MIVRESQVLETCRVEEPESPELEEPACEETRESKDDVVIRSSDKTQQEGEEEGVSPQESLSPLGPPCSKFLDQVVTSQRSSFAR